MSLGELHNVPFIHLVTPHRLSLTPMSPVAGDHQYQVGEKRAKFVKFLAFLSSENIHLFCTR